MNKLKEKMLSLKAEAQALIDSASSETDGVFTESQQTRFDEIKSGLDRIDTQMSSMEGFDTSVSKLEGVEVPASVTNGSGRVTEVKIIKEAYAETGGFKNAHDLFSSLKESVTTGIADKRISPSSTQGSDEMRVTSNPDGGYIVPRTVLNQMLNTSNDGLEADTGAYTTSVPMGMGGVKIPARVDKNHSTGSVTGGFQVYRKAETYDATTSKAQYEQIDLTPTELIGATFATEMLIQSNPAALTAIISSGFDREFTSKLNAERMTGTGAGQYQGILNSAALVTVAKETGQTADTIVYKNIVKMFARSYGVSNARWMVNHDALPQLMLMEDTEGRLIWQPSARDGVPGFILGLPVMLDENCKTVGDAGDIVLANWGEYLEGNVGVAGADESIHVRFLANERCFRFVKYNDGKCWWNTALTPKNSTKTLSPFVTLAARA